MLPRLLVLDTSTEMLYLAAAHAEHARYRAWPGGAQASAYLLPAVRELLAEAGLALHDIDALAYGRGPGAFTGVRAACAVAQGLAFGAGLPVLALDTLMAVAEDARTQGAGNACWVAVDARMGEAYAAHYRHDGERWQTLEAPALYDPAALARRIAGEPGGPAVAGSSLIAHAPAWAGLAAPQWPATVPSAPALLALARAAYASGERLDPAEALPLYVRDKVAQTTAERLAAVGVT